MENYEKQLSTNKPFFASKRRLTVDGPDGDSNTKERNRLMAIQRYEIKLPIYIDNLIFSRFLLVLLSERLCFHLVATLRDHKYFIVDWIRLEALWKASTQLVEIVFFSRRASPQTSSTILIFNWENVDLRTAEKNLGVTFYSRAAGAVRNDQLYDSFSLGFCCKRLSESLRQATRPSRPLQLPAWFISCERRWLSSTTLLLLLLDRENRLSKKTFST